ncbi:D-amino acid dehydrogenase [Rhizorhabdus dicambivorans]|uniref:FAD-dependent oxidoreductase n=1 Tax=Rhizorhabdus dicambivorans TaxID=1850238 RepID=A0A2A4FUL9_9SPHN|nr:D-amino acid dehydrogenase [Rhizorhabdus dicambivorans]ATE65778.1 FAD-dependent oxidoreductase [Rhizorhabdus dicambivorans]PCE41138.1 FAD-dependent oxidoreductase [Rhizorhabdus dicambivorans]
MKVIILGAGVIGVTSAYFLAEQGCDVTVLDSQPGPGLGTSFANAGEITPAAAAPWASPGIVGQLARWLMSERSPVAIRPSLDPGLLRWVGAFLGQCNAASFQRNRATMVALSRYSREQLGELRERTGIAYDHGTGGSLHLFRTAEELDRGTSDLESLRQLGLAAEILDPAQCLLVEPGLAKGSAAMAGGVRFAEDETGDCYLFTCALAELAATKGAQFLYGKKVERLCRDGASISAVVANGEHHTADAYVVCLGSHSPALLGTIGRSPLIYPVKGYSLSIDARRAAAAPRSTIMDGRFKVAVTRLGDRIRIGGIAALCGFDMSLPERFRKSLIATYQELFGPADFADARLWSGLRPSTPSGCPEIGRFAADNLYINAGHGTLGWTMACGAGRLLTSIMTGAAYPKSLDAVVRR